VLAGVVADLPAPSVGPSQVKSATQKILNRPEFRPPKRSLLQAAWHWLTTEAGKLLGKLFGVAGGFGSSAGALIVVALVAVAAVVLVMQARRRRGGARPRPSGVIVRGHGPSRSPADWRAEAAAHGAAGRWRHALRCRYRALVAELVGRGLVEEIPGRTSGEYRRDVKAVVPAAGPAFDGATDLFEQAWYGDLPTGPEDQQRFDDLARQVLTPVGGGDTWDVPVAPR
jgi:hypothetical protein